MEDILVRTDNIDNADYYLNACLSNYLIYSQMQVMIKVIQSKLCVSP